MKSTRLIVISLLLCSLSSCSLLGTVLKLPGQILKPVGRTIGLGLTDEAPQPYDDSSLLEEPTTQEKPQGEPKTIRE